LTAGRRRALGATAVIAAVVIAADQTTTSWAVADLHRPVHLVGPFGLALEYNSGTAFSLLEGAGDWIVPVVVAVLAVVGWLAWRAERTLLTVAYGLVLGGALGNLADRVFRGHHGDVADFVTLRHWPTFNVADACITVGVVLLVIALLRPPRRTGAAAVADGCPASGRGGADDPVDASPPAR
jgi:signal peptidase II